MVHSKSNDKMIEHILLVSMLASCMTTSTDQTENTAVIK